MVAATGPALVTRAIDEARRRFPDARPVGVVHWRAAHALPATLERHLASEHRDRPLALVRGMRARGPVATVIVCDGEAGATALKLLALLFGGTRVVVREDGRAYLPGRDPGALVRHVAARTGGALARLARGATAILGLPVLLVAAWRWRERR